MTNDTKKLLTGDISSFTSRKCKKGFSPVHKPHILAEDLALQMTYHVSNLQQSIRLSG